MAIRGISENDTQEFSSKFDKSENKTVFVIGSIDNEVRMNLLEDTVDNNGDVDVAKLLKKAPSIARTGLKEIRGMEVKVDGNWVRKDFKGDEITDKVFKMLPAVIITEIASKIIENNFLSEGEQKN